MLQFDETLSQKNPQLLAQTAVDPKMKLDGEEMGGMDWCFNSLVTGFIKK